MAPLSDPLHQAPWGDRAIASRSPPPAALPQCDTRELPSEIIHRHLHRTPSPRAIQLEFSPDGPSFTQLLSPSLQDLLIEVSLAQPELVFCRPRTKKLSAEAICTAEHTSFLQSTPASGQGFLDCLTEQWTLSRALCSVSPTRWPSKPRLGVTHPKPLALQSD